MGKIKGTLASLLIVASPINPQLCAEVSNSDLTNKIAQYFVLSGEGILMQEEYKVKGEDLVVQYQMFQNPVKVEDKTLFFVIGDKPIAYFWKGKIYVDKEKDGINCNEKFYDTKKDEKT